MPKNFWKIFKIFFDQFSTSFSPSDEHRKQREETFKKELEDELERQREKADKGKKT